MSSLGLADLRWRARRNPTGGPPLLSVGFLRADDSHIEGIIAALTAYFDALLDRPRREHNPDVAAEIAGDRRLGQGLSAVLQGWYRWTPRTFADAFAAAAAARLAAAGIASPSDLRLRLFDLVNAEFGGFVRRTERAVALGRLAAALGLDPDAAAALDTAMVLDAEPEAVLRLEGQPPAPADVVARYNHALLAAVLRQSVRITFQLAEPDGTLLRRMYARCRRLGIYCDVEGDGGGFRLTLSGPDAVTGPAAAAGRRLAAAAVALVRAVGPLDGAAADLVIHERPYRFVLDRSLLRLPGLAGEPDDSDRPAVQDRGVFDDRPPAGPATDAVTVYDSAVEERFAREFEALRRQGRAAGWRLVREPAPMLAGSRVLIPDFALVRGRLRVFVEVVGFWTPAYVERKRRALEQVPADTRLLLATAEHAVAALAGLPFAVVPYRDAVRVHDVLTAAETRYGDFAERTDGAGMRLAELCQAHAGAGWIAERDLALPLGCLTPGEVGRLLAAHPPPSGWMYVAGAGLLGPFLRGHLEERLASAWSALPDRALSLDDVRVLMDGCTLPERDQALAAVLAQLTCCTVATGALFEIEVRPPGWAPSAPAPAPRRSPVRRSAGARPKRSTATSHLL